MSRRRARAVTGTAAGLLLALTACTSGAPVAGSSGSASAGSQTSVSQAPVAETSGSETSVARSSVPVTVPSSVGSPPVAGSSGTPPPGGTVVFDGVTVAGATNLEAAPRVTSSATSAVTSLQVRDLVPGTGPAATPADVVQVQYVGVLHRTGAQFDSSWPRGGAQLSLEQVVAGFSRGVGGGRGVSPMRVGGRRILVVPSALGYGAQAGAVPPNSDLVFVVDLVSVS